ncbi:YjjW family glycine radical enzyme activase [Providencia rettgeri]|uniref:YjjW family glycine radical enzyme activase n=1 Tax=Providencia TaxID=586 RepID=UPI0013DF89DD|nr:MULTISPECIES: YjjW family glycine radical enzyme activase [unclassified Providencia]QIF57698.1 YjjW family glycine radical enzyme activase [Providencia sp. 1701011]QIF61743.1 YjjW family glycine radical enzyme activase [Providencia sp. 1701091]
MSNRCATLNKVIPFSCVDGPGNRHVIFLQGCNLRCLNCHNPYTMALCDHCGDCVFTCPHNGLLFVDGQVIWDSDACQLCDTCLQTCTKNSSPMTVPLSVNDAINDLKKNVVFLNGVTISGGEATTQLPFIIELFKAIKATPELKHLTCFIDSNGHLASAGWNKVIEYTDGVMIDLKSWSDECALRLTGKDNQRVFQSIQYLGQAGKLYELRLLYIPKQTDYLEHIDKLADFLNQLPTNTRIKINAFQQHGVKNEAASWPAATQIEVEAFAQLLRQRGVGHIHLPNVYL